MREFIYIAAKNWHAQNSIYDVSLEVIAKLDARGRSCPANAFGGVLALRTPATSSAWNSINENMLDIDAKLDTPCRICHAGASGLFPVAPTFPLDLFDDVNVEFVACFSVSVAAAIVDLESVFELYVIGVYCVPSADELDFACAITCEKRGSKKNKNN